MIQLQRLVLLNLHRVYHHHTDYSEDCNKQRQQNLSEVVQVVLRILVLVFLHLSEFILIVLVLLSISHAIDCGYDVLFGDLVDERLAVVFQGPDVVLVENDE